MFEEIRDGMADRMARTIDSEIRNELFFRPIGIHSPNTRTSINKEEDMKFLTKEQVVDVTEMSTSKGAISNLGSLWDRVIESAKSGDRSASYEVSNHVVGFVAQHFEKLEFKVMREDVTDTNQLGEMVTTTRITVSW